MATEMKDKAESAGLEERRTFEYVVDDGDEPTTFYIGFPTSDQIRKAEWHYSKVYNKALVEGVATTAEMVDILSARGLYGPDYEQKLQDLQVEIALKIAEMNNEEDSASKEKLANEVGRLRNELYQWNHRLTGPLSNSCEQMAENAKSEYMTSVVVQREDGSQVWPTYDDFIAEENQGLALKARFEVMLWLQGLDNDFLDKTPENRVLRELEIQKAEEDGATEAPAPLLSGKEESPKRKPRKKSTRKRNTKAKGKSEAKSAK